MIERRENRTSSSKIKFPSKDRFSYYSDRQSSRFGNKKQPTTSSHRKITLAIFLVTVLAAIVFWFKGNIGDFWNKVFKPYTFEIIRSNNSDSAKPSYESKSEVLSEINNLIASGKGDYGVYVYSINNNEEYGINENKIYYAASVNKIPIILAFLKEIEKGNYSGDDEYKLLQADIQDYGTGSMRYEEPGKIYTYSELLELAGKKSDNTAAYVMASKIMGQSNVQKFLDALGFTKTLIVENKTTPKETGQFFVKTYRGEILKEKKYQDEFFSDLTDTDFEERIPVGLPGGTRIAHKIGNEERIYHDCGIVFKPNPYVICIFSAEVGEEEALDFIPRISQIIWDYESQ